ncbi:MAG: anaerobic sulfite reductase subunit AsrB, partial [Lentisphaeria bacterium]
MQNIIIPTPYKILNITKMTDLELLFRVEYPFDKKVQSGQFMQISLPKVGECPISICDVSPEENWVEFLIRKVGIVTDEIFNLNPGDLLPIRGPYGKGFDSIDIKNKRVVIVSGGSGIAPLRSLIKYIHQNPDYVKSLELLHGFKDEASILFKDEILQWR